ncbi:hypothetical protein [Aequorivita capsosiphonis]|uniref:hypothetical protein n=1 Tax=Aequorivita capsosiphonis TaxID=487317 RepID=UPI0005574266|nr:hypothetical protein [Aequorivita capsosiphonis]
MKTLLFKIMQKPVSFLVLIFFSFFISSTTANGLAIKSTNNNEVMEKQTSLIITKKTSLEELENIKNQMKDEGFEFDYSNVVYNDQKEIISISISYKDANNNSGSYSVGSENPINDIVIMSNGNQISVKSKGNGNQAFINQGSGNKVSADRQQTSEDRRAEMEKRRAEMHRRSEEMNNNMAERMQEMRERQTQMRAKMEHERDSVFGNQRSKSSQSFTGTYHTISKNTTDAELLTLEKTYKAENIIFSYNQLERNASNLITHISITINNGAGSISTSSFGNGKEPISNVSIGVDSEHSIMKSAE